MARRPLSDIEVTTFRAIATVLIPALDGVPSGGDIVDFKDLLADSMAVIDSHFDDVVNHLNWLAKIPSEEMWRRLRDLAASHPDDFYWLSTVVVATYLYAPEIMKIVGYPSPHANPAGMFEIADELETGILDPVIERGPVFVDVS